MLEQSRQTAPAPSLGQEASAALLDGWKTLKKRWIWVVTIAISLVVAVAFYTAGQQRIYRSSCVLQIEPTPPKPLGQQVQAVVDLGTTGYLTVNTYYQTQFKIIRSRAVSEETARRLALHHDQAFLQRLSPGQVAEPRTGPEATVEQAAAAVRSRLNVDPIKDSRLVEISYLDPNPERARQILATLVDVYIDRNVDVALASTNNAAEWLHDQVGKLRSELEGAELDLHEYKTSNRILSVSLDDQSNMLRQEIQQLSAALTAARVRRTQVAATAAEFTLEATEAENPGGGALLRDSALGPLRNMLSQAISERDALLGAGKAEQHPLVASASARVEAARLALDGEVKNVREAAQQELSVVNREIESLSNLLSEAQLRAMNLGRLELDYRRLERSKVNTEKLYSLVMERSKESDLTGMMRFNNIQTIDPAVVAKAPVSPRVPFNLALGMLGGLALGLFAAFARESLDRTVKSPEDVEQTLGMTLLGLIPRLSRGWDSNGEKSRRARRRGNVSTRNIELIVHEDSTSAISEAARGIRTNLAFMSPDKPFRTTLITSASPGEGKTTVACCLATALAQAGHRVLLVDCDLRRPRLHQIFGLANDRGVTSTILDRTLLESTVQETKVPGLSVLLSGPACANPAEILQSKSFKLLVENMAGQFDRVIIDSPPVGPVTDAVIVSTCVDAAVLVIRALSSARDVVRLARRSLQDVRSNLVGAVLNAADPRSQGYSYYSRYYDSRNTPSSGDGDSETSSPN